MEKKREGSFIFVRWKSLLLCCLMLPVLQACGFGKVLGEFCGWDATAITFMDKNQNGKYNPGEQPLPNVTFIFNGETDTSDWNGEAHLGLSWPNCGDEPASISIIANVPAGYALTTPSSVTSSTSSKGDVFYFGFITKPSMPTVTPRHPGPFCTIYRLGKANYYDLTDVAITPNDTIWVSSFNAGVFMLAPNSSDWVHYTESQGLVNNQVRSITVESDTSIWFATSGGASHFNGRTWKSYTSADGLLPKDVTRIAIDNNLIWFSTYAGASVLDITTGAWRSFTASDGLSDDFLQSVAVAKDGSIWFAGMENLSRMQWPDRPAGTPTWSQYPYKAENIAEGPDKTLWFAGFSGIEYFNPQTDSLQDYTDALAKTGFVEADPHSLAFGRDDTLWIGSGTSNTIFYLLKDSSSQTMTTRYYDNLNGLPQQATPDDKVSALGFAPNGSLWMITQEDATHCIFNE